MLKVTLLLCSVSIHPSDCTRANAIDFVPLPTRTVICGVGGEAMNAGAGEVLKPETGRSYLKTVCERTREAAR